MYLNCGLRPLKVTSMCTQCSKSFLLLFCFKQLSVTAWCHPRHLLTTSMPKPTPHPPSTSTGASQPSPLLSSSTTPCAATPWGCRMPRWFSTCRRECSAPQHPWVATSRPFPLTFYSSCSLFLATPFISLRRIWVLPIGCWLCFLGF